MTIPDLTAWIQAHAPYLAAPVLAATHTACYVRDVRADLARLASVWEPCRNIWKNLSTTLRLLKGRSNMNALQLVPLALTGAEDAYKLVQAFQAGDKAGAVAAVTETLPLLAQLTGKPEADLAALLTPEAIGVAFDVAEELPRVIASIEAALARKAAAEVPAA